MKFWNTSGANAVASATNEELEKELLFRKLEQNIFPLHIFPMPIQDFILDLINLNLDRGFIGASLLQAYATAIGNRFVATVPYQGFKIKSIMWSCLVGTTSSGKSVTQNLIFPKLYSFDNELYKESETDSEKNERLLISGSTTYETLLKEILPDSPHGILVHRDELKGWLDEIGMYSKKTGPEEAQLLSLFDGKPIDINRSGRRRFTIEKPYLSITGTTQPGMLHNFFQKRFTESGFTYRFLYVIPNKDDLLMPSKKGIDKDSRERFEKSLDFLLRIRNFEQEVKVKDVVFDMYQQWYKTKVDLLNDKKVEEKEEMPRSILAGFLGKFGVYFWRFALIITVLDNIFDKDKNDAHLWTIDEKAANKAIDLVNYFWQSAKNAHQIVNVHTSIDPEVMLLASFVKQGRSSREIALTGILGVKNHTSVSKLIKKYQLEYPILFGIK